MSKILIDIDGVCCDLVGEILLRLNKRLGTMFKHDHITEWNFFDPNSEVFTETEMKHVREIMCEDDLTEVSKVIPGAVEVLEKLKANGHDIVFLTAPWKESKTWCYYRTKWIEKHFGHISKNIIFAWNKEDIPGDMLIDDNPEFILKWQNVHPFSTALLFRQSWNIDEGQRQGLKFTSWEHLNMTFVQNGSI